MWPGPRGRMDDPPDAGKVRRRRRRQGARQDAVPTDAVLGEWTPEIAALIAELPRAQREAVTLAFHGHTPVDISRLLNCSVKAASTALYRGRKKVRRGLSGHTGGASLLLLLVPPRIRHSVARAGRAVSAESLSPALLTTALVPLIATTVLPLGSSTTLPAERTRVVGAVSAVTGAAALRPELQPPTTGLQAGAAAAPVGASRRRASSDIAHLAVADPLPVAATPEDTQFIAAAPAPDYAASHSIVAVGMGRACGCWLLFESTDSGATWIPSAVPAPQGAEQIALPPSWPRDPRIFVGTNPVTGVAPYVIPRFGDLPQPLPSPPGHLALSARFGRGDDRAIIAAQGAVVAVSFAGAPSATPLVTYPDSPAVAGLATGLTGTDADLLVLAPPGSVVTSTPLGGATSTRTLMACRGNSCTVANSAPTAAVAIMTASVSQVTAVSWSQGLAISVDGTGSFQNIGLPDSATFITSVAPTGARVWAVLTRNSTSTVAWVDATTGAVHLIHGRPELARSLSLVATADGHLIDLLAGSGLLCSADGGLSWTPRCP